MPSILSASRPTIWTSGYIRAYPIHFYSPIIVTGETNHITVWHLEATRVMWRSCIKILCAPQFSVSKWLLWIYCRCVIRKSLILKLFVWCLKGNITLYVASIYTRLNKSVIMYHKVVTLLYLICLMAVSSQKPGYLPHYERFFLLFMGYALCLSQLLSTPLLDFTR